MIQDFGLRTPGRPFNRSGYNVAVVYIFPLMANRLSKITTRTGDDGTTGLGDGSRIAKDALRIEVIGEIDELNSVIGVVLTEQISDSIREILVTIQHDLFDLGGELCVPGREALSEDHLTRLDVTTEQ